MMGMVYLQECDLDGSALLDVHRDDDGDIWIVTTGDGSVMLEPESARKLAEHLLSLPGVAASSATSCPGHGRPECATCCWQKGGGAEPVAEITYTGYEPSNSIHWLNKGLAFMEPGTKLYAVPPAPAGYTAVDMSTAAADGYRDGAARVAELEAFLTKLKGEDVNFYSSAIELGRHAPTGLELHAELLRLMP
jgi:hypothetical protein